MVRPACSCIWEVAAASSAHNDNLVHPLYVSASVPAGNDEAYGRSMVHAERMPIHLRSRNARDNFN